MAGAHPGSVVAVELFVEEDVITPMWIVLEPPRASVHRTLAVLVAQEDPAQAIGDPS